MIVPSQDIMLSSSLQTIFPRTLRLVVTFNVDVVRWLDFNTYTDVTFMSGTQLALKISRKTKVNRIL